METKNKELRNGVSGSPNREFENKPIVETQLSKSKDGKYLIHKTIITDIKPVKYYKTVFGKESA